MIVVVNYCTWVLAASGSSGVSHLFPQRWDIRRTLYFAKKRVQYGSGGIEATEAVNAGLVGGKLHHDRTWNGTRGISSDGIQRHKVRVVERTLHDARCRRAQDHHSHPVESAGRSQGEPVDDHRDRP